MPVLSETQLKQLRKDVKDRCRILAERNSSDAVQLLEIAISAMDHEGLVHLNNISRSILTVRLRELTSYTIPGAIDPVVADEGEG